ncbi:MAG: DEAD/DEAH box helicase [Candidatus Omnitrophica bacterium]|nr:DEAD/DEAH box helicase [Candidatus Omnitrophota bacterium]MBD3269112.1 DEAD/DEAH box helicase [Candidatus Omnitrophota bacterium]
MRNIELDRFQKEAINCAKNNNSVIVSAPTGAGKTLIAERIIEDSLKHDKRIIYTAPIKALSNQKFRDFSCKYPDKTGIVTGDVSINRTAPLLIMTTEIFRNTLLVESDSFKECDWIIFDEIHYLDDVERGTVWEESIILLPPEMKMLALSATIPNIDEFTDWLNKIHKVPIKNIIEPKRPVPLHFYFQCNNQIYNKLKDLKKAKLVKKNLKNPSYKEQYLFTKPNRLSTLLKNINTREWLPCLYFSFSRRRCEELAQEAASYDFLLPEEKEKINEFFATLLDKFDISSSYHVNSITALVKKGIAYHHAGLLPALKEIIERLFQTGLIKVIFTTETFALGVNMPAKTVVFDSLSKFYGRYHAYLKTRDFYQMAGRSGRRGIDEEGYVISRINSSHIDLESLEKIIYGRYEPIKSQLNSCYATILNLYNISGNKIFDIYPNSFHFHQSRGWQKKEMLNLIRRKIKLLKDLGYIEKGEISIKGELASRVYGFELTVGELFSNGFLLNCKEEDLFTLITSLVYEPRKGERRPKFNKKLKKTKKDMNRLMKYIHKKEKHFRISPLSKKFFFHLSDVCRLWIQGASLIDLNKVSTVDEGEIIRYFRMSIQVLREIKSSQAIPSDFKSEIRQCIEKVNRDEVNARKQLSQKI